jgi:acyl carrier protein
MPPRGRPAHHPGQAGVHARGRPYDCTDALKRCSAATRDAACEFRRTGKVEWVPAIIHGLIEHYVEPEARAKLKRFRRQPAAHEDLAIDSLTMLEIVFLAEEVLQVSIDNEELRPFKTVGDVKRFIVQSWRSWRARRGPFSLPA